MATPRVKINAPEVFDGDRRKAQIFLRQCQLYMMGRKRDFEDDTAKIAFTLSYMRGGPAKRWSNCILDAMMAEDEEDPFNIHDWKVTESAEDQGDQFDQYVSCPFSVPPIRSWVVLFWA